MNTRTITVSIFVMGGLLACLTGCADNKKDTSYIDSAPPASAGAQPAKPVTNKDRETRTDAVGAGGAPAVPATGNEMSQ